MGCVHWSPLFSPSTGTLRRIFAISTCSTSPRNSRYPKSFNRMSLIYAIRCYSPKKLSVNHPSPVPVATSSLLIPTLTRAVSFRFFVTLPHQMFRFMYHLHTSLLCFCDSCTDHAALLRSLWHSFTLSFRYLVIQLISFLFFLLLFLPVVSSGLSFRGLPGVFILTATN